MTRRGRDVPLREVRRVDHHAHVIEIGFQGAEPLTDVLLVINDRHEPEQVGREAAAFSMNSRITPLHEGGDRRLPGFGRVLATELGGTQVTIGWEPDVVVLNLVEPEPGCFGCQRDVGIPQLFIEGVDPGNTHLVHPETAVGVLHGEVGPCFRHKRILEHDETGNRVDVVVLQCVQDGVDIHDRVDSAGIAEKRYLAVVIHRVLLDIDHDGVDFGGVRDPDQVIETAGSGQDRPVRIDALDQLPLESGLGHPTVASCRLHRFEARCRDRYLSPIPDTFERVGPVATGDGGDIA